MKATSLSLMLYISDDIFISDITHPGERFGFYEAWDYCKGQNATMLTIKNEEWWLRANNYVHNYWKEKDVSKKVKYWIWGTYNATGEKVGIC